MYLWWQDRIREDQNSFKKCPEDTWPQQSLPQAPSTEAGICGICEQAVIKSSSSLAERTSQQPTENVTSDLWWPVNDAEYVFYNIIFSSVFSPLSFHVFVLSSVPAVGQARFSPPPLHR